MNRALATIPLADVFPAELVRMPQTLDSCVKMPGSLSNQRTFRERPYLDLSPLAPHCAALGFFLPRILTARVRQRTRAGENRVERITMGEDGNKGQKTSGLGKWKRGFTLDNIFYQQQTVSFSRG